MLNVESDTGGAVLHDTAMTAQQSTVDINDMVLFIVSLHNCLDISI